jgi:hypothetical protein
MTGDKENGGRGSRDFFFPSEAAEWAGVLFDVLAGAMQKLVAEGAFERTPGLGVRQPPGALNGRRVFGGGRDPLSENVFRFRKRFA